MSDENTNQDMAAGNENNPSAGETADKVKADSKTQEKAAQKQMVEQAMIDSKKTQAQQVAEMVRYPALKIICSWAKMTAIIVGVLFIVLAIISLFIGIFGEAGFLGGLINFVLLLCIGMFFGVICFAMGDFSQLMIDIEENTRKNAKK